MMVSKNPQNVHRKYFWAILVTFIFDVKIDVSICKPHYFNLFFLWTSSIVCMFDFWIFNIFLTTWHLFDILTHQFNLNHLSPHRAIFVKVHETFCSASWCSFQMSIQDPSDEVCHLHIEFGWWNPLVNSVSCSLWFLVILSSFWGDVCNSRFIFIAKVEQWFGYPKNIFSVMITHVVIDVEQHYSL